MGERSGDFGSAFRADFNGSFARAGQSGEPVSDSSTTPGPQPFHDVNLADIFPPRPTFSGSPAPPLPVRPDNQTMPSLNTSGPHAIPSDSTALPHAENNSSGAEEPQDDAQELLEMADWADGVLGDLDDLLE
ncbi:hypothetical protein MMC07_000938 [Pseudocyphellaria aurata]|nr:hypothetical protein [Pseudocyphellaria aurata]